VCHVVLGGIAMAMLAILTGATVAIGSSSDLTNRESIHLEQRGGHVALLFLNPKHTAFGDQIVINGPVYEAGSRAGRVHAVCTFMDPKGRVADCSATTFLRDGSIAFSTPVHFETNDQTVGAVIGGSGRYRNARGQVVVTNRTSGNAGFLFELEP
jgi:hypothetical protein